MNSQSAEMEPISIHLLDDISGTEFNERLISLEVLRCYVCCNILRSPILLVPDGYLCESCNDGSSGIRITALETVLANLLIPCRYRIRGCIDQRSYSDISEHELVCKHRNYDCPFCNWKGSLLVMQNHFLQEHTNQVLFESKGYFNLSLKLGVPKMRRIGRLLRNSKNDFILLIQRGRYKLQFVVYHIKYKEKASNFLYTVEIKNGVVPNKKFEGAVQDTAFRTFYFDTSAALNIDIMISVKADIYPKEDNKLLRAFECPVCNNFMKPPIVMCVNGHSLCSKCKPQLQQCPTCRGDFSSARNFTLETISNDIHFPCGYRDQGCQIALTGLEIVDHESDCVFKTYNCPEDKCIWKGSFSELIDHLQTHSTVDISYDSYLLMYFDKLNIPVLRHYIIIYDSIFLLRHLVNHKFAVWDVKLVVSSKCNEKLYKYEIGLIDSENINRKFVQTEIITDASKAILISYETLSAFSKTAEYGVYCKISKIIDTNKKNALVKWFSEQKAKKITSASSDVVK